MSERENLRQSANTIISGAEVYESRTFDSANFDGCSITVEASCFRRSGYEDVAVLYCMATRAGVDRAIEHSVVVRDSKLADASVVDVTRDGHVVGWELWREPISGEFLDVKGTLERLAKNRDITLKEYRTACEIFAEAWPVLVELYEKVKSVS